MATSYTAVNHRLQAIYGFKSLYLEPCSIGVQFSGYFTSQWPSGDRIHILKSIRSKSFPWWIERAMELAIKHKQATAPKYNHGQRLIKIESDIFS